MEGSEPEATIASHSYQIEIDKNARYAVIISEFRV